MNCFTNFIATLLLADELKMVCMKSIVIQLVQFQLLLFALTVVHYRANGLFSKNNMLDRNIVSSLFVIYSSLLCWKNVYLIHFILFTVKNVYLFQNIQSKSLNIFMSICYRKVQFIYAMLNFIHLLKLLLCKKIFFFC